MISREVGAWPGYERGQAGHPVLGGEYEVCGAVAQGCLEFEDDAASCIDAHALRASGGPGDVARDAFELVTRVGAPVATAALREAPSRSMTSRFSDDGVRSSAGKIALARCQRNLPLEPWLADSSRSNHLSPVTPVQIVISYDCCRAARFYQDSLAQGNWNSYRLDSTGHFTNQ